MKFLELIDAERWQKIQDSLAVFLKVPMRTIGEDGAGLVNPSQHPALCTDVIAAAPAAAQQCLHWYPKVISHIRSQAATDYYQGVCPLGLSNIALPVVFPRLAPVFLVVGPVVIEHSHSHANLSQHIQDYRIDEERFFACYNTLPLLDTARLKSIVELLQLVIGFAGTVSEFAGDEEHPAAVLDKKSVGLLLRKFLNLAMKLCGAEIGSVMIFEQQNQALSIQDAEGLSKEIMDTTKIKPTDGIAGLSIQRRESLFINDQLHDREVRLRMHKPKIKSAFVIPVFYKSDVLGVVSIATAAFPNKFCDTLMELLNELVAMALEKVNLQ